MSKSNQQRRQELIVIWGALVIIAVSVLMTLWFSGVLFGGNGESSGYQNVTFTDAQLICENASREQYSGKLQRLNADDHSSRFDSRTNQYKIFFNATIASPQSETGSSEFFISCYVSAERGRIADYDASEKKEQRAEAIRKDEGGMFGWPINK